MLGRSPRLRRRRRRRRQQDVPAPAPAATHTLKERALHPFRSRTFDELHALDDVTSSRAGRVLRHRRPQRLGQEHAAEVPRRDLRVGQRRRSRSTGRLSPFIELGVGFNPDLTARDNVIINAIMLGLTRQRGARALRRDHRVRRARGVRRPQAQELLVGHERAARVRGRDPGRRRRAAHRRGARRRRRRVPAEVLRAVPPAARTRAGRSSSSRTTWARSSASATARCCSSAGSMVDDRRAARRSRAPTTSSTSAACVHDGRRRHARYGDRAAEIRDAWFEDAAGERVTRARAGRAAAGSACEVALPRRPSRTRSSRSTCATRSRHTVFATATHVDAGHDRHASRPASAVDVRVAFENWLAPSRYTLTPSVARAGPATTRSTCARTSRSADRRTAHAHRRRRRPPARRSRSSGVSAHGAGRAVAALGVRRATPALLGLTVDARGHRLQAALLRLGRSATSGRSCARSLFFGVVYLVFTEIVRFGNERPNYAVYILFVARAVPVLRRGDRAAASTSLVERENLLRKMRFPRLVIPLVGGAHRAVQPRADAGRGVRLRVRHRASSRAGRWLELIPLVGAR